MSRSRGQGWKHVSLETIAEFRNGINYNKTNFGAGIRVIGVKDFQDRSIAPYADLEQINPHGVVRSEHILREGDVIFVRSNGNRELIGRSLFVLDLPKEPITHSAFTIRVRMTSPEANPRFFAYLLRSRLVRDVLSAQGNGANISNLNQEILSRLQVPLPTLCEQERIAAILSAYDDLIENNMRRIAILEEMARRIYEEWFVRFRFPGHENVRMVESELGPLPDGWIVRQLSEVTAYINRGLAPKYDDTAPMLVINQKCIRDQRLNLSEARRQSKPIPTGKQVQLGDVLINSTGVGTLGRVAQVLKPLEQCTVDTHVSIVRPSQNVDIHFFGLSLFSKQSHFEAAGVGSTGQTELSRARIAETPIVMPELHLQKEFAEVVRPIRDLALNLHDMNSNLRDTRDLLLPRLISGELDFSSFPEPEAAVA